MIDISEEDQCNPFPNGLTILCEDPLIKEEFTSQISNQNFLEPPQILQETVDNNSELYVRKISEEVSQISNEDNFLNARKAQRGNFQKKEENNTKKSIEKEEKMKFGEKPPVKTPIFNLFSKATSNPIETKAKPSISFENKPPQVSKQPTFLPLQSNFQAKIPENKKEAQPEKNKNMFSINFTKIGKESKIFDLKKENKMPNIQEKTSQIGISLGFLNKDPQKKNDVIKEESEKVLNIINKNPIFALPTKPITNNTGLSFNFTRKFQAAPTKITLNTISQANSKTKNEFAFKRESIKMENQLFNFKKPVNELSENSPNLFAKMIFENVQKNEQVFGKVVEEKEEESESLEQESSISDKFKGIQKTFSGCSLEKKSSALMERKKIDLEEENQISSIETEEKLEIPMKIEEKERMIEENLIKVFETTEKCCENMENATLYGRINENEQASTYEDEECKIKKIKIQHENLQEEIFQFQRKIFCSIKFENFLVKKCNFNFDLKVLDLNLLSLSVEIKDALNSLDSYLKCELSEEFEPCSL